MAVTPATSAAHVFVTDLARPALEPEDRHHLERVLRLRAGTTVTVGDGRGRWRTVTLGPDLTPSGEVATDPAVRPVLSVAFAVVKGDRTERAARALTEVGVDRIVLLQTERSVVRWAPGEEGAGLERVRRVVRSAAMQCRRAWLPEVPAVVPFGELSLAPDAALAAAGGGPVSLGRPTILVGPEGGWSPAELQARLPRVGLGPHVLRTETAAMVAGALMVAARSARV